MRLGIGLGLTIWPGYGGKAGSAIEPPPGDQWIAGQRMWQDTDATTPATAEGDPVLSWTTLAGRKLTVVGAIPMRAMLVDGVLTPCNGPTSNAFWMSDDQHDIRSLDLHMVVSHTASIQFGAGVDGRLLELQGYLGGALAYDNSTVAVVSPARFATRVPKTMIGITTDASGMRVWRDGAVKTPASGRPTSASKNIAIGDINSTGTIPAQGCAWQRIYLGLDTNRTAVLAEHATYAALPSRPWCITYTDSMGTVRSDAAYHNGHHPTDGLNRRLNETHNVVGISFQGGTFAAINTTGMYNAALQEVGVGVSSAPDDGRLLLFFVTNDLLSGGAGATYAAAVTARADAFVAAFAFNADQIVIVIPAYRYSPFSAATYNAEVDSLATALSGSAYLIVDLRSLVTSVGGGIHTDGVHMTAAGLTAAEAAIRAVL